MADQAKALILASMEAPLFTSGTPAGGVVGAVYSFAVTASGFPAPMFTVTSGALPAGLTLNPDTGEITGTPTATGVSTFALTTTNSSGSAVSPSYTLAVNRVPVLTSGAPAAATAGESYNFTVTASGVPAPTFQVATGALPAGLNLNAATGEITGTPTTAGPAVFSVSATNVAGAATSPEYTMAVAPPNVARRSRRARRRRGRSESRIRSRSRQVENRPPPSPFPPALGPPRGVSRVAPR